MQKVDDWLPRDGMGEQREAGKIKSKRENVWNELLTCFLSPTSNYKGEKRRDYRDMTK